MTNETDPNDPKPETVKDFYLAPCMKRRGNVHRCEAKQADFWAVYWTADDGMSQCIGDFKDRASALAIGRTLANAADKPLLEWSPDGWRTLYASPNRVYSNAETALCVYEDLLDSLRLSSPEIVRKPTTPHDMAVNRWREDAGIYALRQFAIEIAPAIDLAWQECGGASESALSFDWEIVPAILRMLDINEDALTIPSVTDIVARIRELESEYEARASQ